MTPAGRISLHDAEAAERQHPAGERGPEGPPFPANENAQMTTPTVLERVRNVLDENESGVDATAADD